MITKKLSEEQFILKVIHHEQISYQLLTFEIYLFNKIDIKNSVFASNLKHL